MGFLASLGIKDAVYAILIASLGGLGLWYHHHVVKIGEQKIINSDARAVAAEAKADSALKTTAALAASIAQGDYSHEITVPVTDAPIPDRLCRLSLSGSKTLVVTASATSGNAAPAGPSEDAGSIAELQQFADDAVKIAADDDAQVIALQTILADIRQELGEANVN